MPPNPPSDGKDLAIECLDFWRKAADFAGPSEMETDLPARIRRFQETSDIPDEPERESLIRFILCRNGTVRRVWNRALDLLEKETRPRNGENRNPIHPLARKCLGHALWIQVETCISRFQSEKLERNEASDFMSLLSKYVSESIHVTTTLEKAGLRLSHTIRARHEPHEPIDENRLLDESRPDPETRAIENQQWLALEDTIETGFRKARATRSLEVYIHEVLTEPATRSALARQQKKRLRTFLRDYLERELVGRANDLGREAMDLVMERLEIRIRENLLDSGENPSRSRPRGTISQERKEPR